MLWTLIVVASLPVALRVTHRAVTHLFRPVESPDRRPWRRHSAWAAVVGWVARALLIVAAIWVLAWGWQLDLVELAGRDTPASRLSSGLGTPWPFFWWPICSGSSPGRRSTASFSHGAQPLVSTRASCPRRRSSEAAGFGPPAGCAHHGVHRAGRHGGPDGPLLVGVQIAPLVAGAGVVGLAIGFGAQTLVKDIISGMFFLLDDAFRVGEYIESGSIRGTVEHISIRSLRLRHHRGALHTIPFGSLDTITNYSRDW